MPARVGQCSCRVGAVPRLGSGPVGGDGDEVIKQWAKSTKFTKPAGKIADYLEQLLASYDLPAEHWSIYSPRTRSGLPSPRRGIAPRYQGTG